jgi:hypothetical protein
MPTSAPISRATFLHNVLYPSVILGSLILGQIAGAVAGDGDRDDDRAINRDDDEESQNLNRLAERNKKLHSDSDGKVRPDLLRKGMEHARQMPTANSIGGPALPAQPRR